MRAKQTKGCMKALAVLAILAGMAMGKAYAAPTASTALKVTVGVNLSVAIGSATYDFGNSLTANQSVISTGAIPVTNDSSGLTEDYQIYGSSTASWDPGVSTNTTLNNFNLRVLISTDGTTVPGYAEFAGTNTGLLDGVVNSVNMTNAAVGRFTSGHGDNITSGTTKYLWFRFITPASISVGNNVQQSVTVTVVAANSTTF